MINEKYKAKFLNLIEVSDPDDCWQWKGGTDGRYGAMYSNGKKFLVHRISYGLYRGDIPKGMTIDHVCNNRLCVNPDHLRAVTSEENNRAYQRNRKRTVLIGTRCKKGHLLDEKNVFYVQTYIQCKTCRKITYAVKRGLKTS